MLGNFGSKEGISPRARIAMQSFWEHISFVMNSLVFLLIGLEMIGLHCAFVGACYGRRVFPDSPFLGDPLLSTRIGRGEVSEGSC